MTTRRLPWRAAAPAARILAARILAALALAALVLAAWPGRSTARGADAGDAGDSGRPRPRVLCIGMDGMDPQLLRQFMDRGLMPHFRAFVAHGDLKNLGTAIPPQSPVAWSNFITGMNPGGHGIFDFIHRDPATLTPYLSAAQAMAPQRWWKVGPWKIPRESGTVRNLRHGTAFWQLLDRAGVDVTVFKVPSNFPPVECEAHTLSGMGTPDILGTYGIFTYYTDDPPQDTDLSGGRVETVTLRHGAFTARVYGPVNSYREGDPETTLPLRGVVDRAHRSVLLELPHSRCVLREGEWSDWQELRFTLVPGLKHVSGVARFYLMSTAPLRLYLTPVNIDPVHPEMPISTPRDYSRRLAEALGSPYYTQGLPEDTKALEDGVFDDDAYVSQSNEVLDERLRQFRLELDRFAPKREGLLFFYFNLPDQTCHTFWRNMDPRSPNHDADAERHHDRIARVYAALDSALGMALERVDDRTLVMVISDHGFAPYYRSFHLNRWLYDEGYLVLKPGVQPADVEYLSGVDWHRTRAYAIGINGLYINLRGRERRGIVNPGPDREALLAELVRKLEAVVDPVTGKRVVRHAYRTDQVYSGPYVKDAPDIIVGYDRGYRGSNESALGEVPATQFVDNMMKWSGDHCMAADVVPGIIACNRRIDKPDPQLLDLAPTFLQLYGVPVPAEMVGSPIFADEGDR